MRPREVSAAARLEFGMTTMEIATLIGLLVVPVVAANSAVLVTRYIDAARDAQSRRMDVFRTLMRTRRTPTSVEHVGALNLVEIEFAKNPAVVAAWKELFTHFAATHVPREEERIAAEATEDSQARKERFEKRIFDERQRLLAKLLHAMAKVLNFRIEQLEIFEGGYTPQGWQDENTEYALVRRFFIDMYAGRVALPVVVFEPKSAAEAPRPEPVKARKRA